MQKNTYPFKLPPLPYDYDALEPYIDAETLHYHHDKHFQNYVNGLNKVLENYPRLQNLTLEQLLSNPGSLPQKALTDILHNGGGVYNHNMYFNNLSPAEIGGHMPEGALMTLIERTYKSFGEFQKIFMSHALGVFGSGWTCLFLSKQGSLRIIDLKNQDTTLVNRGTPIIIADVWEHAYYLKYKNLRADYINGLWELLSFPEI